MNIPYDPDFDHPARRPWGDVFAVLGATRSFWIGIVLSFLIAGTIGFIVLLVI
ncbi:MAG: hypothetical protein Q7S16_01950 [bacterium]|nr:hypothetical protein [bacterium]